MVTSVLIVAFLVGGINNLCHNYDTDAFYSATLLILVSIILVMLLIFTRTFALKAQDRAIWAEESLRHYVLTGKLPDPSLKLSQLIASRFASGAEYVDLVNRLIAENLSSTDIKKAITNWRANFHRV